jgi:four helix bundle protein
MGAKNYADLVVWQKAMDFVEAIYRNTACFPKEEIYGITSQLRRAAVSIPANIAEGQGRHSKREFRRFTMIAHGSLREAETHIMIAERLRYLDREFVQSLMSNAAEIGRLLIGLANALARSE